MEPCRREQTAGPDRQHAGRPARRRWAAGRAGIPYRTLGDRAAGQGSGRNAARCGCGAVRRVLQRSVRRADAGHRRNVRQPAVSQRRSDHDAASDSIAASPRRRHRHRDVRQRAARHDAGAGRLPSPARHRRPRRRHAAGDRRRGRRKGPDDWRALRARSHRARRRGGDGLPCVRHARRRLSVPGNCRDVSGDRRGTRDDPAAQRALPVRRADLARHGAPVGHGAGGARRPADSARDDPDSARDRERDADPRRVRRFDEPVAASSRAGVRRRPRATHGRGLAPDQPDDAASGGRPAERPGQSSDGAGVHGGRRARSDAPPATDGSAPSGCPHGHRRKARRGARLVGSQRSAASGARASAGVRPRRSEPRDHGRRRRARERSGEHGRLPGRQHRAGRLVDQGDGDRSGGRGRRQRVPASRTGTGVRVGARRDRGHQRHR